MDDISPQDKNQKTDLAVDRAISNYIRSRKGKVPEFSNKFFSLKGALKVNKRAFGSDLFKAPVNILWTLPYICAKASSSLLKKMGFQKIPARLERLPVGFETKVQQEINWAILTSFSGIVTDPIQHKLGIHQRRLFKFLDSLDRELRGRRDSKFHIRDQYIARIFDLLDLIKKAAKTFV
jgi:hypothetical protein